MGRRGPYQAALIERALAKDPAARFPDGAAFAAAVRRVAGGGTMEPATAMTTVMAGDDAATRSEGAAFLSQQEHRDRPPS